MTTKRVFELCTKDLTLKEMLALKTEEEFIVANWGLLGYTIVEVCKAIKPQRMTYEDFLSHCTACGGDWTSMLLSGIKELYPIIWELIPDDMGINAFAVVCNVQRLLNIREENEA